MDCKRKNNFPRKLSFVEFVTKVVSRLCIVCKRAKRLYEYETWSFILREEYGLRVIERKIVRRKFGPQWD
jgi:hypothetical protein